MISKSQLKYIQSLGQKKHRDEAGVFIAEGPKLVTELLQGANVEVLNVYGLEEWIEPHRKSLGSTNSEIITETELERMSQLSTPNQVIAVVKKIEVKNLVADNRVSLVLNTIQDPGNLGTIIRTSDWFGVTQVICSSDCADIYSPKVVQSTMGSISRVRVLYTDLAEWLSQQKPIPVYATVLDGDDVSALERIQQGLIIIGNESRGIDDNVLRFATNRITIKQRGEAESLNAAVATGIVLSHLV